MKQKNKTSLEDELESNSLVQTKGDSIYFYSDITKKTALKLIKLLEEKEEEVKDKCPKKIKPIKLFINTYGGCLASSFLVADRIEAMKRPVHAIVEGNVASGGTVISMVGNKRYIRPRAKMLIHQHRTGCWWGTAKQIEDFAHNSAYNSKAILKFYKDYTLMDEEFLNELLKSDLYFNAEDCVEMGFADEILKG